MSTTRQRPRVRARRLGWGLASLLLVTGAASWTQENPGTPSTNGPAASAPVRLEAGRGRLDETAFRIITERNIFDANRSGGTVRLSSRRPSRVESFKLVGTMAYEKGTFAFFEGSNAELTRALKCEGIIAGHKLVAVLDNAVKLEADGKVLELAIGSAMRREDEGQWRPGEAAASSYGSSSRRDEEDSRTRGRDERDYRSSDSRDRSGSSNAGSSSASSSSSSADQAEILKRLMERRERESE